VLITAGGSATPTAREDVAIGLIQVGGRVERASFLAGYNTSGSGLNGAGGINADASIGRVTVGGAWVASNLVAGATTGPDLVWGTADDALLSGAGVKNDPALRARIGLIILGSPLAGSTDAAEHFGLVAEEFSSLRTGRVDIPLTPGPGNDVISLGSTGNFTLREV
jgi:hypothetical protein